MSKAVARAVAVACMALCAVLCVHAITTIPYDNTLVLGNLIDTEKIKNLQDLAELQKPVDNAQDEYNALLRTRLSLAMSREELRSLAITDEGGAMDQKLADKQAELDKKIGETLMKRIDAEMQYEDKYAAMVGAQKQKKIGEEPESPLDFSQSQLQDMPISSDTMNLDVQYFRHEAATQDASTHVSKVSMWVSGSVQSVFGLDAGSKAKDSTENHMNSQHENNELLGTLCIYVSATHKKAKIFSPTKYDALKLVRAWNMLNKDVPLDLPAKADDLYEAWVSKPAPEQRLNILSGVTYGSSFVGFIHFVKTSQTQSYEQVQSSARSAQAEATYSNFFATITGGWGMDSSSADDVKSLMSSNLITSHVGLMTMGLIPSLASQGVETALKKFTTFSPDDADAMVSKLATSTASDGPQDMDTAARANIRAGKMSGVQKMQITSVLTGISEVDKTTNQVIDMNSLMLALDDYIKTARDADGGVPVNFFVAQLDQKDVLREYYQKFRVDLYNKAMLPVSESDKPADGGSGGDGGGGN